MSEQEKEVKNQTETASEPQGKKKETAPKKPNKEFEKIKAESEEYKRKWYAVTAEYENYRRRTKEESLKKYADGRNDVISSLFPIGDNLERAMQAADEKTKEGLQMVLKSFQKILEDEHIEEINPVGLPFDVNEAEAVMAVPKEGDEESGIVKQVYLKGYKKGDKILRYAQVIVTQ